MNHADSTERAALINGFRGLVDYLESNPEVPAPGYSTVFTFPPDGDWSGMRAEIDSTAARLGVTARETGGGHYVDIQPMHAPWPTWLPRAAGRLPGEPAGCPGSRAGEHAGYFGPPEGHFISRVPVAAGHRPECPTPGRGPGSLLWLLSRIVTGVNVYVTTSPPGLSARSSTARSPSSPRATVITGKASKRMSPIIVLAGVGVLAVSALIILAVLIIGIHRGDRRHLASAPKSHSDAFARRLLVGVRYLTDSSDEADR